MAKICVKCHKKIGFLSGYHKNDDESLVCISCLEEQKQKQDKQDKQQILDYINTYTKGKDDLDTLCLINFSCNIIIDALKNSKLVGEPVRLNDVILQNEETLKRLQSSMDKSISIEEQHGQIKTFEFIIEFYKDVQKIQKLFEMKGLTSDLEQILVMFTIVIEEKLKVQYENEAQSAYEYLIEKFGKEVSIELIVKDYLREIFPNGLSSTEFQIDSIFTKTDTSIGQKWSVNYRYNPKEFGKRNYDMIVRVLEKLDINYEQSELKEVIKKSIKTYSSEQLETELFSVKKDNAIGDYNDLSGYDFEDYLKNVFTKLGYSVINTPKSGDQGADLILSKDGRKAVVQAKKYSGAVSNKAVQEIVASKKYYEANEAIVVTTGEFTKSAIELAYVNNVKLWDKKKLDKVIKKL